MLYVIPAPVGAVIVIVPVATEQVGCAVTLPVGVATPPGCVLTTKLNEPETHPLLLFAVTLYVPDATPVKLPEVLV